MPEINLPTKALQDSISTNVGSNADASSATGSVHAKLKDVKAVVATVDTNVGSQADAPSATGSLHAKMKYMQANSGGIKSVQRGTLIVTEQNTAKNITISAINMLKSTINVSYIAGGDYNTFVGGGIISSTQISVIKSTSANATPVTIYWEVIEFN